VLTQDERCAGNSAEITPGRRHDIAVFRHRSKRLFLAPKQYRAFQQCSLPLEQNVVILTQKGLVEPPPKTGDAS
jgi:hypothetical protein